ncbi:MULTISPECIES: winged helix-turn-helix transcriptional regulator [unclassified Streptomyces]|uniref:LexA family protein n=1 Tax=unclassified Streptomyces TaxID=2593676 RepID=UPI002DDA5F1E|nr:MULTISPECIES: winged helix-turn-helix transcriptional regulator [unclassified Streptomyces]WSA96707.1 winged helix-turn-helix transcriptional regulator [Streptomyces sp. NBC_01795]WSB81122.1 winged helix-turn-helix transcriptional regulator [Streptomyces sp. NBC_01775]WSS10669.1 winged helix-turn-helix transcriptional regulator [Streptomyces sp. NBC_01186]WSS39363.1 winged helix-turn-helix transcriptional regulator [Streptomyces sp. NBC_01187]
MTHEQQERILRAARKIIVERGEPPTMRELADAVGLSSASTVAYHLQRLRERGLSVETRGRSTGRCPLCDR